MTAESPKMGPDEFREAMYEYRKKCVAEGNDYKDPLIRLRCLRELFERFDADERNRAYEVLGEWVLSAELYGPQNDALHLIEELNVTTALPALREMIRRYAKSASPVMRDRVEEAERVAVKLTSPQTIVNSATMSPEEFRRAICKYWDEANEQAKHYYRDPHLTLVRLRSLFSKLDADDRSLANEVLAEWLLSDNDARRYHASVLVGELNVTTALPAVEELIRRLSSGTVPHDRATFDRLRQLAAELTEHQRRSGAPRAGAAGASSTVGNARSGNQSGASLDDGA